jgi:hypothetical protein
LKKEKKREEIMPETIKSYLLKCSVMTERSGNKNDQNSSNQNQSLQDQGAAVPDYGRTSQLVRDQAKEQEKKEGELRRRDSSHPTDKEDTLGIP